MFELLTSLIKGLIFFTGSYSNTVFLDPLSREEEEKYIKLSNDNISEYLHSPNKTLLYIIKTTNIDLSQSINMKREEWIKFMRNNLSIQKSSQQFNFGNTIIYNDYEKFIEKVTHAFLSI